MYRLKVKAHQDMSQHDLDEVIQIKSTQWSSYSYHDHLEWITKNLKSSDIHIVLMEDGKNLAYVNLIDLDLEIDGSKRKGLGVGNVCAIRKGQGFGHKIMEHVNRYITESENIGLLFCKKPLLKFYKNLGWRVLDSKSYAINCENLEVMILNEQFSVIEGVSIKYDGIIF